MPALAKNITDPVSRHVQIVYISQSIAAWWNRRRPDEVRQFCGFYWINGTSEAGPFRTRSAAIRDAYYQFILGYSRSGEYVPSAAKSIGKDRHLIRHPHSSRRRQPLSTS